MQIDLGSTFRIAYGLHSKTASNQEQDLLRTEPSGELCKIKCCSCLGVDIWFCHTLAVRCCQQLVSVGLSMGSPRLQRGWTQFVILSSLAGFAWNYRYPCSWYAWVRLIANAFEVATGMVALQLGCSTAAFEYLQSWQNEFCPTRVYHLDFFLSNKVEVLVDGHIVEA